MIATAHASRRHRRLRPDRPQARGGARRRRRSSAASTSTPRGGRGAGRRSSAARAVRLRSTSCWRWRPTSSVVAVTHDQLAELRDRARWRPARTCSSRSRRASASPTSTAIAAAAAGRRPARQGRLQPSLPSRRSRARSPRRAPGGSATSCTCAPATATAAGSATSSEWRADRARSGGGELVDQGMHLLDLSTGCSGALPLHSRAAAHASSGTCRSRTTRRSSSASRRPPRAVGDVPRHLDRVEEPLLARDLSAARPSCRSTASRAPTARSG